MLVLLLDDLHTSQRGRLDCLFIFQQKSRKKLYTTAFNPHDYDTSNFPKDISHHTDLQ